MGGSRTNSFLSRTKSFPSSANQCYNCVALSAVVYRQINIFKFHSKFLFISVNGALKQTHLEGMNYYAKKLLIFK